MSALIRRLFGAPAPAPDLIGNVALALHEAALGSPCHASGRERAKHIHAYRRYAEWAVQGTKIR